jgi:hypothetical protein
MYVKSKFPKKVIQIGYFDTSCLFYPREPSALHFDWTSVLKVEYSVTALQDMCQNKEA